MFNEFSRAHAIRVMEKLIDYPSAQLFLAPVDPIKMEAYDYYDIIKKPVDISSILNNLLNGTYQTFFEWRDDIHQISKNAKLYNGENHSISILADQLVLHFDQAFRSFYSYDSHIWKEEYDRISSRLASLIDKGIPATKRADFTSNMTLRHAVQNVFDTNNSFNTDSKDQDYLVDYDSLLDDDFPRSDIDIKKSNQMKIDRDDTFVPQEMALKSKSKSKHNSHSKAKSSSTENVRTPQPLQVSPQKDEFVSPPELLSAEKAVNQMQMPINFGFDSSINPIQFGINSNSNLNTRIGNSGESNCIFGDLSSIQSNNSSFFIAPPQIPPQKGFYDFQQQPQIGTTNQSAPMVGCQVPTTNEKQMNSQTDESSFIDVTDYFN